MKTESMDGSPRQEGTRPLERGMALIACATSALEQGKYPVAYRFAIEALKLDRSKRAPWLIAAAAVSRLGNPSMLEGFTCIFCQAFSEWARFPEVVRVLVEDPSLEPFIYSPAFSAQGLEPVLEAYRQLCLKALAMEREPGSEEKPTVH